jgi:hypothetical protein
MGLILLTGEPRSIAEAEIVSVVVALWWVLRPYRGRVGWRARVALAGWLVVGAAWGALLSLAQLLPGWAFINASQRASETYSFFGSGSLHPQWSVLLLVPDLFGGAGLLHQPLYFNSYNLPEVTGYVGLFPLVALVALGARSFGRRRDPQAGDWGVWMVLVVLGLFLSWGFYTPLGHLFWHIPLFGKTRLQSRSLGIVDLGLAALLGYWVDGALARRGAPAGAPGHAGLGHAAPSEVAPATGRAGWLALVPPLAAGLCCLVAIIVPGPLERAFSEGGSGGAHLGRSLTWWLVAQLAVAGAAGAVVLGWPRGSAARWGRALCAVVVLDLVLFSLSSNTSLAPGSPALEPTAAQAAAVLGTTGRFAIYDTTAQHVMVLSKIGQPDLNAFTGLPSVQGYGSIVDATYGSATGAHLLDLLDPCALARGVFEPLRLRSLITLPDDLAPEVPAGAPEQVPLSPLGTTSDRCPGAPAPGSAGRRTLYLGQQLTVRSVEVVLGSAGSSERSGGAGAPRVAVLRADGAVEYPTAQVRRTSEGWRVRFADPEDATAIVVVGAGAPVSDRTSVTVSGGARYDFLGVLQDALGQTGWRYRGQWEGFTRFERATVAPPVWLAGGGSAGRARLVSEGSNGTAVVRVTSARPVTLVRSEAYQSGWHAEIAAVGSSPGGPASAAVRADGLVQSVRVPAGTHLVTFRYRPRGLTVGLVGSGVALGAFVVLGAVSLALRRRSRVVR